MKKIGSLEELKKYQHTVIKEKKRQTNLGVIKISVGLGSCGIASGALETLKTIRQQLEVLEPGKFSINKTGCIGLCKHEPIVNVTVGRSPMVTYGQVNPEVARRIVQEHILGGKVVEEHVIESIPLPTI
ncbi:MAG TPA: (2Fe-2S) ferredoxin domain-containing protein [Anaerolineales bacterium]|nr:(2Fe-2S) ferredoxin domain-containing protein [Anaerolineales bacterium]